MSKAEDVGKVNSRVNLTCGEEAKLLICYLRGSMYSNEEAKNVSSALPVEIAAFPDDGREAQLHRRSDKRSESQLEENRRPRREGPKQLCTAHQE